MGIQEPAAGVVVLNYTKLATTTAGNQPRLSKREHFTVNFQKNDLQPMSTT
jgi:hypothetical protein